MKAIKSNGVWYKAKDFYNNTEPLLSDQRFYGAVPYNLLIANRLYELGFSVCQELQMPEVGIADIFAYKDKEIFVAECKSEKDRDFKRAVGQILTYTIQLREVGYKIDRGIIFARTEPLKGRTRKDIEFLNKFLPFKIEFIRVSNKTPLLKI